MNPLYSASPLNLSMDDNGILLTLPKGHELHLHLRASPATGFDWHTCELDHAIVVESSRAYQADSKALGSPAALVITYKLVGVGNTRLVLKYQRTWETGTPPLQTFVLNVTVEEA